MPEHDFRTEDYMEDNVSEKSRLRQHAVDMEKELMRMRRAEKVLREVEQRYLTLMDSSVFLCAILTPDGKFRAMNRRAEEFFGFQVNAGTDVTLQSFSGPGYTEEADSMLKEAMKEPLHATFPVVCSDGAMYWLDMECSRAVYQGESSLQIIASDITGFIKGRFGETLPVAGEREPKSDFALQALNSCPGLLCFVVDQNGVLLHATRGYREVAKRFLGQECTPGLPYPVNIDTPFDLDLQDIIQEAFLGHTAAACLAENAGGNIRWDVTGAPLLSSAGAIAGAIVNLTPAQTSSDFGPPDFKPSLPAPKPADCADPSQTELLNAVVKMFFVVDGDARCVEANANFLNALKLPRGEVVGHLFSEFLPEGEPINKDFNVRFEAALSEKSFDELECKIASKNGDVLSLSIMGARLRWEGELCTLVSCADNTKLRRTEEQLKRVSLTDMFTGALNRQGMERVLITETERALRYRGSLTMIILDIDGFRQLNERIGYSASDAVLKELVASVKSRIRMTDFLGRWGGDELMILTPVPAAGGMNLAEMLRDLAEHTVFKEDSRLTISAGVAEFRKYMDISSFVGAAFDAMIDAKKSGGNSVRQAAEIDSQPEAACLK